MIAITPSRVKKAILHPEAAFLYILKTAGRVWHHY